MLFVALTYSDGEYIRSVNGNCSDFSTRRLQCQCRLLQSGVTRKSTQTSAGLVKDTTHFNVASITCRPIHSLYTIALYSQAENVYAILRRVYQS